MKDWIEYVRDAQIRDQEHWSDIGKYGVSKIGGCLQRAWFEILGKHTETYKPQYGFKKIYFVGTAVHELIQNWAAEKDGAIKERRVEYTAPDQSYSVLSHVDLIFPDIGVVDIKTTWSKPENYDPKSAINQVNFYMGLTGIHIGGILVVSLANVFDDFKPNDIWFVPHEFDQQMFKSDLEKLGRLTAALKSKTPIAEYEKSYCKYCPYSHLCPEVAEHDKIYEGYWKAFMEELDNEQDRIKQQEQNRKDAVSDHLPPAEKPVEFGGFDLELNFSEAKK